MFDCGEVNAEIRKIYTTFFAYVYTYASTCMYSSSIYLYYAMHFFPTGEIHVFDLCYIAMLDAKVLELGHSL